MNEKLQRYLKLSNLELKKKSFKKLYILKYKKRPNYHE